MVKYEGNKKTRSSFKNRVFCLNLAFFAVFSGVADGTRTRNGWNHNPGDPLKFHQKQGILERKSDLAEIWLFCLLNHANDIPQFSNPVAVKNCIRAVS